VFVTALQQTLNGARRWFAAGAAPLAEDGQFGPATQALVKAVQTWGAIQSTGTPNDQTWAISVGPTIWDVAGPGTAGTKPHQEPTVRRGSKGEAVQIAQFLLSAQGFGLAPHQVDGNFGQATHDAVVRFQRAHKLTADGVVGPGTWKQLFAHPPVAETPPTLHHGASGPVVRALQTALNQAAGRFAAGQKPLAVDGHYGPATVARVREFQVWGEVIVDGIMGYRTWSVSVGASLWTQ
jgi:peptidoglycan hydrolase-like protein with peptidoglycan-binding domain